MFVISLLGLHLAPSLLQFFLTTGNHITYCTLGIDPICWESNGGIYHIHDEGVHSHNTNNNPNAMLFNNDLIKEFRLDDTVKLLSNCPSLNNLKGRPPILQITNNDDDDGGSGGGAERRLRTGTWYNYTLDVSLNVKTMGGTQFVSDLPNNHRVSLQVIVCTLGVSGFCSPFIHDESNARLEAQGIYETPDDGESHGGTHVSIYSLHLLSSYDIRKQNFPIIYLHLHNGPLPPSLPPSLSLFFGLTRPRDVTFAVLTVGTFTSCI